MKILSFLESFAGAGHEARFAAPSSRRDAFKSLGSGFGDVAKLVLPLGGTLLASTSARAQTTGRTAVEVLNFALLLEYLEADYYNTALDTDGLLTGDIRETIEQIAMHENSHVDLLTNAVTGAGGTPTVKPEFDFTAGGAFSDVFSNQDTFLAVAQAFEDTGVRAYKGQAGFLAGTDTLTVALQIHSVEARHAAKIRRLRGASPWIAFDRGIEGVPATDAVYAGENNLTQLGLNAQVVGGISAQQATEAYDEPLNTEEVTAIASLFIV